MGGDLPDLLTITYPYAPGYMQYMLDLTQYVEKYLGITAEQFKNAMYDVVRVRVTDGEAIRYVPLHFTMQCLWVNVDFYSWDLLRPPKFTGWNNFKLMMSDKWFWNSIWVSIKLLFLTVPMTFFIPLVLALTLYKETRSSKILRAFFYCPYMIPAVAGTTM